MENNKAYKTKVKKFLGEDVRTVRVDNEHEYIICKDMFDVIYGVCKSHKQTYDAVLDMVTKKYLK